MAKKELSNAVKKDIQRIWGIGMRFVFILLTILLLAACGGNSEEELTAFIESFNENAVTSPAIHLINEDEVGEQGELQVLDENSYRYTIYAKYEGEELTGYRIKIDPEHDAGYKAAEVIAETLGLDEDNFRKSLDKADAEYTDNGYDITIYHTTVDFDKN